MTEGADRVAHWCPPHSRSYDPAGVESSERVFLESGSQASRPNPFLNNYTPVVTRTIVRCLQRYLVKKLGCGAGTAQPPMQPLAPPPEMRARRQPPPRGSSHRLPPPPQTPLPPLPPPHFPRFPYTLTLSQLSSFGQHKSAANRLGAPGG